MSEVRKEIITFKVDSSLAEAMRGIPNRSDFIRNAILAALENSCPLCKGTGILTPEQKEHWQVFAQTHLVAECHQCSAMHLVCTAGGNPTPHDG